MGVFGGVAPREPWKAQSENGVAKTSPSEATMMYPPQLRAMTATMGELSDQVPNACGGRLVVAVGGCE